MRPFEGIRVVDLTHVLAGPSCTYQLALLGADVIKVERPTDPDQTRTTGTDYKRGAAKMATSFLAHHANKRCITLDLKSADGLDVLKRLVATADVLVQNYRPGSLARLGIGYEAMAAVNPRLVYASVSGYGHRGPNSGRTATDQTIQATTGIMATTGTPEVSPLLTMVNWVDYAAGVYAAFGIASALFQRDRTGKGQHVDVAMYDVALAFAANFAAGFMNQGSHPKAKGNSFDRATMGVYDTADGQLVLAGVNMPQQKEIWELLGRPDLVKTDEKGRREDFSREYATICEILKTRTAAEWEEFFNANNVPASKVRQMGEAIADPHLAARQFVHRFDEVPGLEGPVSVFTSPLAFDHDGPRVDTPPARHDQHTEEVLGEIGLTGEEIAALRQRGVVGPGAGQS